MNRQIPAARTEPDVLAVRKIPDGIEIDLQVSPDLAYLAGHFRDLPIVPGVAQVDWVVGFARRKLGIKIESAQSFQVKFRQLIRPGVPLVLRLQLPKGAQQIVFRYASINGDILSSGIIAIAPPETVGAD